MILNYRENKLVITLLNTFLQTALIPKYNKYKKKHKFRFQFKFAY